MQIDILPNELRLVMFFDAQNMIPVFTVTEFSSDDTQSALDDIRFYLFSFGEWPSSRRVEHHRTNDSWSLLL